MFVVIDRPSDGIGSLGASIGQQEGYQINVSDVVTHESMLRLAESGVIAATQEGMR